MGSSLSLFRANVECPFGSPVFIPCESVPLSVFLWTCHLQPSRPTLPPSHSSPNSELMPTSCWPLTHIFIFLFLFFANSRAFSFIFLCSWKPHLFKCPLCDQLPLTHRLCTQHPLGGGRWPSLSLSRCFCLWPSPYFIFLFLSCCPSFLFFPLCPVPSFPIPSPPALLPVCTCMRLTFIAHLPLCLHGDTGMRGRSNTGFVGDDDSNAALALNAAWPTDMCSCTACIPRMTLNSLSLPPQWSVSRGVKKATNLFLWTCVCSVHVWMLWLFCMSLILCIMCPSDGLFCVKYMFLMSLWVLYKGQFDIVPPLIVNVLIV